MAKGKKTGGRNFQPGQSGNPLGGAVIGGPDLRAAKHRMKETFERMVLELCDLTLPQLTAVMNDPETPSLKVMIATVMIKGASMGDPRRVDFLLDRLVGPVPKPVELTGAEGAPIAHALDLSSTDLTTALVEIQRLIKERACNPLPQKSLSPPALPAAFSQPALRGDS